MVKPSQAVSRKHINSATSTWLLTCVSLPCRTFSQAKTAHLKRLPNAAGLLEFASGDLLKPGSFDEAFAGVNAVLHAAAVVLTDAANVRFCVCFF